MTTLIIATRNRHKTGEIRAVLGENFTYLSLSDFPDAPAVVEDADSFAGNAMKKASELARWLAACPARPRDDRVFVLADDSGLEVDALNGAPGVYSARFAAAETGREGNCSDAENNAKLLRLLQQVAMPGRTARFRCVIALAPVRENRETDQASAPGHGVGGDPATVFEGACEGKVLLQARGGGGFGYDPLFQPAGFDDSFAELGEAVKNQVSHRARALARVREWLCRHHPPGRS